MLNTKIFIANWKMNKSFNESLLFVKAHMQELIKLAEHGTIILCPSFVALYPMIEFAKSYKHSLFFGAQNCSQFDQGSYTGEVDAISLYELGVTYCIVGHSERRLLFNESNSIITEKIKQLLNTGIKPIICIGETGQEYQAKQTISVIGSQLQPILEVLTTSKNLPAITLAYEPIWSIGTGVIPDNNHLAMVYEEIQKMVAKYHFNHKIDFLYGGSVDQDNTKSILNNDYINGLLIGGASLNFQKFQKIVSLQC